MSRRSRKNFRRCGSRITFSGTFPANPSPGQTGLAPKYPLVESLPVTVVNGQSWRIAEVGRDYGREYLGRSVVELDGPDYMSIPPPCEDLASCDWRESICFRDVNAGSSGYPTVLLIFNNTSGHEVLKIVFAPDGKLRFELRAYTGGSFAAVEIDGVYNDGNFHHATIEKIGNTVYCRADQNEEIMSSDGWDAWNDANTTLIYDSASDVRPLQVCNLQQSLNGTLIDNIPCTDSTGTELANTATPSRPAMLSDADAHALAWVPQDSVTNTIWQWQPPKWVDLTP